MAVAAIAAILGATTLWVLAPRLGWTRGEPEPLDAAGAEREELRSSHRQILASIKDLEMEYRVGKLTQEDFQETRERLTREAVDTLRRIDREAGESLPQGGPAPGER